MKYIKKIFEYNKSFYSLSKGEVVKEITWKEYQSLSENDKYNLEDLEIETIEINKDKFKLIYPITNKEINEDSIIYKTKDEILKFVKFEDEWFLISYFTFGGEIEKYWILDTFEFFNMWLNLFNSFEKNNYLKVEKNKIKRFFEISDNVKNVNESLYNNIIGNDYYKKITDDQKDKIFDSGEFEKLTIDDGDEYEPLMREFVSKHTEFNEGVDYSLFEKHIDKLSWSRNTNEKIDRFVYTFRWIEDILGAFAFCYLYRLPDDFVMIQFRILPSGINDIYIIDTFGGLVRFKRDILGDSTKLKLNESVVSNIIKGDYYKRIESVSIKIIDDSEFESISEEESEYYLPFIRRYVEILSNKEEGSKDYFGYHFEDKYKEIIDPSLTLGYSKKIQRWNYVFKKNKPNLPSHAYCYLYKLSDDYIIINFWIIGAAKGAETYIFDLHYGIEKFKLDKNFDQPLNTKKINESISNILGNQLWKRLEFEDEIVELFKVDYDKILEFEFDVIHNLMEEYLKKFEDIEIEDFVLASDKHTLYIRTNSGDITFFKFVDEYFLVIMEIPIVIKDKNRNYYDTRSQTNEFIFDSIDGIKQFVNEEPAKVFYKQFFQSVIK